MRITDIQLQKKNQNRASFSVDGQYCFSLTITQYADKTHLKIGYELQPEELVELQKLYQQTNLRLSTIDWIYRRPRSCQEVRLRLKLKGLGLEEAEKLVAELQNEGYLNDAEFARWWVESRSNKTGWSRAKIQAELKVKGLEPELINSTLQNSFDDETEKAALLNLIHKKRSKYDSRQKLIAYLVGKGFRYSSIREALAEEDTP